MQPKPARLNAAPEDTASFPFGDPRVKPFVWDRIVTAQAPECPWMWIGFTDRGYGRVVDGKRKPYLARYMYEHLVGPVPEGWHVEHTCHSLDLQCYGGDRCPHRLCAWPEHFAIVPASENLSRRHNPQVLLTHCVYGHPYTAENTYVGPRGGRYCRMCCHAAHNGEDRGPRLGRAEQWLDEGNPAKARMVLRCPSGHPLVGTNAIRTATGQLDCRVCVDYDGRIRRATFVSPRPPGGHANFGDDRLPRRFWAKVEPAENGCWLWQGSRAQSGHGTSSINGVYDRVHRHAYRALVGRIPDGLVLDHVCHTNDKDCYEGDACPHRRCVRPDHLQLVTQAENARRMHCYQLLKTHCPKGHPYDEENTRWYRGTRYCIACTSSKERKEQQRRWRQANLERVRADGRRSALRNREKRYAATREWHRREKAKRDAAGTPTPFRQHVLDTVLAMCEPTGSAQVVVRDLSVVLGTPNKTNVTRALQWLVKREWLASPADGVYAPGVRTAAPDDDAA